MAFRAYTFYLMTRAMIESNSHPTVASFLWQPEREPTLADVEAVNTDEFSDTDQVIVGITRQDDLDAASVDAVYESADRELTAPMVLTPLEDRFERCKARGSRPISLPGIEGEAVVNDGWGQAIIVRDGQGACHLLHGENCIDDDSDEIITEIIRDIVGK